MQYKKNQLVQKKMKEPIIVLGFQSRQDPCKVGPTEKIMFINFIIAMLFIMHAAIIAPSHASSASAPITTQRAEVLRVDGEPFCVAVNVQGVHVKKAFDAGEYSRKSDINGPKLLVEYFSSILINGGDDFVVVKRDQINEIKIEVQFKMTTTSSPLRLYVKPMLVPSHHSDNLSRSALVNSMTIDLSIQMMRENKGRFEFTYATSFKELSHLHSIDCQNPPIFFAFFLCQRSIEREFFEGMEKMGGYGTGNVGYQSGFFSFAKDGTVDGNGNGNGDITSLAPEIIPILPRTKEISTDIFPGQFVGKSSILQLIFEDSFVTDSLLPASFWGKKKDAARSLAQRLQTPTSVYHHHLSPSLLSLKSLLPLTSLLPPKDMPIALIPCRTYMPTQVVCAIIKTPASYTSMRRANLTINLKSKYTDDFRWDRIPVHRLRNAAAAAGAGCWRIEFSVPVSMPPSPYLLTVNDGDRPLCEGHLVVAEKIKVVGIEAAAGSGTRIDLVIPVINSSFITSRMELRLEMISLLKDSVVGRSIESDRIIDSLPFVPDRTDFNEKVKMNRSVLIDAVSDENLFGKEMFTFSLISFYGEKELIIASSLPFAIPFPDVPRHIGGGDIVGGGGANIDASTTTNVTTKIIPLSQYCFIKLCYKGPKLPLAMSGQEGGARISFI